MLLEIVTPEEKVLSKEVEDVYLPGAEGEIGVLSAHTALVSTLEAGELHYKLDGENHEFAVGPGFIEVTQEKVVVLTDLAVTDDQIDEDRVEAAKERAEKALSEKQDMTPEEISSLQATIAKSIAQLKLKRKDR